MSMSDQINFNVISEYDCTRKKKQNTKKKKKSLYGTTLDIFLFIFKVLVI